LNDVPKPSSSISSTNSIPRTPKLNRGSTFRRPVLRFLGRQLAGRRVGLAVVKMSVYSGGLRRGLYSDISFGRKSRANRRNGRERTAETPDQAYWSSTITTCKQSPHLPIFLVSSYYFETVPTSTDIQIFCRSEG
jgi:hypothetical protein